MKALVIVVVLLVTGWLVDYQFYNGRYFRATTAMLSSILVHFR
jgi:hypothetical protein